MQTLQTPRALSLMPAALALVFVMAGAAVARAQESNAAPTRQPASRADVNHEVHLHVLVTAEGAEGAPRVPQSLDAVVRQLKAGLPPSDYRLAATFINRVRDNGTIEVRSAGGSASEPGRPQSPAPPLIFQIVLTGVKLSDPAAGQQSIGIHQFRLGVRAPVQTTNVTGEKGGSYPVTHYEEMGVTTQLSVREGEPTLVGTLSASRPNQLYAIVLTVRRAGK